MQTATSETESKSLDLSICVHHYTLRAPCPKGQGNMADPCSLDRGVFYRVFRAIPTTSALSHIRYTLRHEAQTCLFIKEMGPLGFSVNAIDPILVFNGHDGILEVRINSEAQKWGGLWTAPFVKRNGAGPAPAPMCSAFSLVESN